jgi:hypothetical protein
MMVQRGVESPRRWTGWFGDVPLATRCPFDAVAGWGEVGPEEGDAGYCCCGGVGFAS